MLDLQDFLERNDFNVHFFEQDGEKCAEIEKWTDGGVDIILLLRPFTFEEFKKAVDEFDINDEIRINMQNKLYSESFTYTESVADFTAFHNDLKEIVENAEK